MVSEKSRCLFCDSICEVEQDDYLKIQVYTCEKCGKYGLSIGMDKYLHVAEWSKNIDAFKAMAVMYYFFKHKDFASRMPCFIIDKIDRPNLNEIYYIYYDELKMMYPKNFSERIDRILVNLTILFNYGNTYNITHLFLFLRLLLFIDSMKVEELKDEVKYIFSMLDELGYVTCVSENEYQLSAKGRARIQELKERKVNVPQGFIAMWFNESMELAKSYICKAISDCGYKPLPIDIKEHNNQIVPEIFFEIKQSTFLVADLTGHRNGVYYEAGYAQALGIEVILLCKEDDFGNRHFDVAQKNIIIWKDESDLYNRLTKRIIATVGKIK
ncbi:MAG TPA: hypothetical protein PK629_11175 [Oscillospiraceae bacterium]|nr:hypothetical protein [Oscillospiraceae bacterium]HPK34668.1 hypothetical protein [Oscillospiraceae bacterium]HPR74568.1 hypothetical protein [Oscillospiraceae bacterium]